MENTAIVMGKVADGEYVMEAEMVFHLEAVQRVIDSRDSGDKTAPPTYTDDLVTGGQHDHTLEAMRSDHCFYGPRD